MEVSFPLIQFMSAGFNGVAYNEALLAHRLQLQAYAVLISVILASKT